MPPCNWRKAVWPPHAEPVTTIPREKNTMQTQQQTAAPTTTVASKSTGLINTLAGLGMSLGLGLLAAAIRRLTAENPDHIDYLAFVGGGLLLVHGLLWKIRCILREERQPH